MNRISYWIDTLPNEINSLAESEVSKRPLPNKWSKKEIIGHLCDSANNNIARFVNIQYADQPFPIQPYNQEKWVEIQNYQETPLDDILKLFCILNKQIINIIRNIPPEKFSNLCIINDKQQKTLEWLIEDYLEHMEHHINNQILNKNNI